MTKEFVQLNNITIVRPLFLVLALTLLAGCGRSSGPNSTVPLTPGPLSAGNLNLVFVVSQETGETGVVFRPGLRGTSRLSPGFRFLRQARSQEPDWLL